MHHTNIVLPGQITNRQENNPISPSVIEMGLNSAAILKNSSTKAPIGIDFTTLLKLEQWYF